MLAPVSPEHRERLCFLGYKKAGQVVDLPLEVLRSQFDEEGLSIHRAVRGGMKERVEALYPLRCVSARFSFESPVESTDALERGLAEIAEKLSEQLRASDLQGCDLSVRVGYEDDPEETLERNFAKPMQSAASVLFGLKLVMKECLGEDEAARCLSATERPARRSVSEGGSDSAEATTATVRAGSRVRPDLRSGIFDSPSRPRPQSPNRPVAQLPNRPVAQSPTPYPLPPTPASPRIATLRVRMPNLVRATRKQGNLYTLQASRQLTVAETAFEQMRKTYGTDAVLACSQMQEPRRKRVLQVWKDALGWV